MNLSKIVSYIFPTFYVFVSGLILITKAFNPTIDERFFKRCELRQRYEVLFYPAIQIGCWFGQEIAEEDREQKKK